MRQATLHQVNLPNVSIRIMTGVLQSAGFDVDAALTEAAVPKSTLDDLRGKVSGTQELAFQKIFVRLTADRPDLWVATAQHYQLLAYGQFGIAMLSAPTLRDMMDMPERGSDYNYSLVRFLPVTEEGPLVWSGMDSSGIPDDILTFSVLRDVIAVINACSDAWGGPFPFERFEVALPDHFAQLLSGFDHVPFVFGAEQTRWYWAAELQDKPLSLSNPIVHMANRQHVDAKHAAVAGAAEQDDPLVERLTTLLMERNMRFTLDETAASLGMSNRTLQRKLKALGIGFRALVGMARHNAACQLLTNSDTAIANIAWRVGYSDVTSFNHAFRKQAGMSPTVFRKTQPRQKISQTRLMA